jgi:hypothetical protein
MVAGAHEISHIFIELDKDGNPIWSSSLLVGGGCIFKNERGTATR